MSTDARNLETTLAPHLPSRAAMWGGRIASGIAVLFLAFDTIGKLLKVDQVLEGTAQLGYPVSVIPILGVIEVICLLAYLIPRTAVIGAILWTGYLGGAIATHLRLENPLFTHVLFPVYVALLLWGGLYFRDARVRRFLL